ARTRARVPRIDLGAASARCALPTFTGATRFGQRGSIRWRLVVDEERLCNADEIGDQLRAARCFAGEVDLVELCLYDRHEDDVGAAGCCVAESGCTMMPRPARTWS